MERETEPRCERCGEATMHRPHEGFRRCAPKPSIGFIRETADEVGPSLVEQIIARWEREGP